MLLYLFSHIEWVKFEMKIITGVSKHVGGKKTLPYIVTGYINEHNIFKGKWTK